IVNATSAGRDLEFEFKLPLSMVNSMTTAVDLNYGEAAIAFLAGARAAECRRTGDGVGLLVVQAAVGFLEWA
ncbi:shikimate dehydrogenase, partial [Stenotrophomonas maltophilia]